MEPCNKEVLILWELHVLSSLLTVCVCSRGEGDVPDGAPGKVREHKERLQVELRTLRMEKMDQTKRRKEQNATEVASRSKDPCHTHFLSDRKSVV